MDQELQQVLTTALEIKGQIEQLKTCLEPLNDIQGIREDLQGLKKLMQNNPDIFDNDPLISKRELASMLDVSFHTVYRYQTIGWITPVRIQRRLFFRKSDVHKMIQEHLIKPNKPQFYGAALIKATAKSAQE